MALATAERLGLEIDPNGAGQLLQGFGGGHALSRGSVSFEMTLAGCQIELTALVTEADMGQIELLLGQAALNTPGVTMVVRGGRIYLTTKPNIEEFFANITLEEDGGRCRVILAEDVTLLPDSVTNVDVEVHGVPGVEYFMDKKSFPHRRSEILIPAGVLKGERGRIKVTNGGEETILWRKGRLLARAEACRPEPRREGVVRVRAINVFNDLDLSDIVIGDVTGECKRRLLDLLGRKANCFSKGEGDLGLTNLGEMQIKLTSDIPIYYRPYRLSYRERELVRDKVQTLLKAGVIRESESAYASPIILIPKKSGEIRMCVDYRALNAITVTDRYPLPLISDQLDRLANKNYFTTLDLAQGFHQVPMHPDSVDKTAFITPDGHYEYLRVPFGLANSPAVFQRVINKMLGQLRYGEVLAYIDDLLIPSATEEEGLELLALVLDLVEKAGVKLKLAKCSFLQASIEYLGHEISGEGVRPGRRKIEAVMKFPEPKDVHGVRQFVGLASYFRKFVHNFSAVARPLTDLTKKDVTWRWDDEQRWAFAALKERLVSRPLLAVYDSRADIELHTDASKLGVSGILLQKAKDGQWRPVEYFSRATTIQEQMYHS
nr:unnamed protein product [Callosobruchus analis]